MTAQELMDYGMAPLSEMAGELAGCAVGVPLRSRDGTLKAFAMVDAEDYAWVSQTPWYRKPDGYVVRNVPRPTRRRPDGRQAQQTLGLHRAVLGLGPGDREHVDHIDHDKLNNTKTNLRSCTHAQNHQNRNGNGGSSRFRGVSLRKDKATRPWAAYGVLDRTQHHIGFFDTEEEAADAAAAWREMHMPFSTN